MNKVYQPFYIGINEMLPEIREVFIEYYGEEYRESITDRFNNFILKETTSLYSSSSILRDIPYSDNLDQYTKAEFQRQKIANERPKELEDYNYDISLYTFYQQFNDKKLLLPVEPWQNGNGTYVNALIKDNTIVTFPIIYIDLYWRRIHLETFDYIIIHELNHGLEAYVYPLAEDWETIVTGTGCSYHEAKYDYKLNRYQFYESKNYNRLNEVLNELISREITQLMHNKGIYLSEDKDNLEKHQKINRDYSQNILRINDFYTKYKKVIIESRINCDLNILVDAVGENYLDELEQMLKSPNLDMGNELRKDDNNDKTNRI